MRLLSTPKRLTCHSSTGSQRKSLWKADTFFCTFITLCMLLMSHDMLQSEMQVPHETGSLQCRSCLLFSFVNLLSTLPGSWPIVGTDWEWQGERMRAGLWIFRAGTASLHFADWIPSSGWFVRWMWFLRHIVGKGCPPLEVSGGCIWWRYFFSWFLENRWHDTDKEGKRQKFGLWSTSSYSTISHSVIWKMWLETKAEYSMIQKQLDKILYKLYQQAWWW